METITNTEILTLEQVECGYPSGFQLGPLSFSLQKGDFTAIIGPNGSGKSTLFKSIVGDLTLQSGSVRFKGESMRRLTPKERARRIAVVSQEKGVSAITVEEYVLMGRIPFQESFGFFYSRKDRMRVDQSIEQVGISHLRNQYITELSAGQLQMVTIASALAQEPQLLLLDEPTSHLDITHQIQLMNLLQEMNDDHGLTILMILHDLNLAGEYCDRLLLMNEGRLIKQGTPQEVLTYSLLESVYQTPVVVQPSPLSGRPFVFPVSQKTIRENR